MFVFSNNAHSLLAADIAADATELQVLDGQGERFPEPAYGEEFAIVVQHATTGEREIMYVTERLYGDTFTVLRAREDSVAIAFPANSKVIHTITAGVLDALRNV